MIKIIFISVFIAASANAVSEESDANDDNMFPRMTFPKLPNFLDMPYFPRIPDFQNFQMPSFKFPEIKFPKPDDITKHKEPGYQGVSVVQNSDGTTTIITNKGGVITKMTVPDKAKDSAIQKSKDDLEIST